MCCLRKRRRDKDFEAAREQLANEMDLVLLIRHVRFLKAAVGSLLTSNDFSKLQEMTEKRPVDEFELDLPIALQATS